MRKGNDEGEQFGDRGKSFERELRQVAEVHLEQTRPGTFDLGSSHDAGLR